MSEISILSEHEIATYITPTTQVAQRVITYQTENMAPRTLWVNSDQLPDAVYQSKNPGKTVPADIQAKGDAVRRAAIEAAIAKIGQAPKARKI